MFREMRRHRQRLPREEAEAVLTRGSSGVLALLGDGGYPYALPISYVYANGSLYFHSALAGHKIDAIRDCDRASFCVIDQDQVVPQEYTTYYRSVIAFGRIQVLEGAQSDAAIELLAAKYSPDQEEGRREEIRREQGRFCMLELRVEHLSGKEAMELTRKRHQS